MMRVAHRRLNAALHLIEAEPAATPQGHALPLIPGHERRANTPESAPVRIATGFVEKGLQLAMRLLLLFGAACHVQQLLLFRAGPRSA